LVGLLFMIGSASAGVYLGWQIRDVIIQIHIGESTWTGHLYGLLILGASLACWFFLGAAFVQCRIAERRAARTERSEPAARTRAEAVATTSANPKVAAPNRHPQRDHHNNVLTHADHRRS
jgi:hypothetical protein